LYQARETFGAPQFLRSALGGVTVTCERAREFFVAPFRTSKDKGFRQMYKSEEFFNSISSQIQNSSLLY
jgi:hypothetical protein